MDNKEKKDKGIAIAGTIVVHALVVLILVLTAFRTPLPLPAEQGVEIKLDEDSGQGSGNNQSEAKQTSSQHKQEQPKQEQSSNIEEEIISHNNDEVPVPNKPKSTKQKQDKPTEPNKYYKPSNQSSDGETEEPDLGKIHSSDNGKGNGGNGNSGNGGNGNGGNGGGNTKGNGHKNIEAPSTEINDDADIYVDCWVNREGIVERAEIAKGTLNADATMLKKALEAAKKSTYSPDPNRQEEYIKKVFKYDYHINY